MGLSNSKLALPSQLAEESGVVTNVIGQCLGNNGGHYLFLGDALVPSSGMMWVPMLHSQDLYIARMRRIFHGADELDKDYTVEYVMFDSRSTYTYFVPKVFKTVLSAVQAQVRRWGFVRDRNDLLLSFCWRGKRKFKFVSDVSPYFGTITLDFGGNSVFELPRRVISSLRRKGMCASPFMKE